MADSKPRITITYCTQCQWLLRAGWMAQELLSTFATDLGEVALVPGTGGIFTITCDDQLIWDRKRDGGFPDAAKLKQLVRDVIDPERDLGHSDRHEGLTTPEPSVHMHQWLSRAVMHTRRSFGDMRPTDEASIGLAARPDRHPSIFRV